MDEIHGHIFANAKILIAVVDRDAISEDSHHRGYLLMCAKCKQTGCISLALKIAIFGLASIDDIIEKRSTHSVTMAKDMSQICRYLGEEILHENVEAERTVARNAMPTDFGS
jgi:hypothetical protein